MHTYHCAIAGVPYAGAITPVSFETSSGHAYVVQLNRDDGKAIPFGSEVKSGADQIVGYVGQNGQAFVRLPDDNSLQLSVNWDGGQCAVDWQPGNATVNAAGLNVIAGTCHAR